MGLPLEQILIQTINGLVNGMILALVASGLTLIFGIMDVVNFAHGELVMLGAFTGATTLGVTGNFWLALVVATLVITVSSTVARSYRVAVAVKRAALNAARFFPQKSS